MQVEAVTNNFSLFKVFRIGASPIFYYCVYLGYVLVEIALMISILI